MSKSLKALAGFAVVAAMTLPLAQAGAEHKPGHKAKEIGRAHV